MAAVRRRDPQAASFTGKSSRFRRTCPVLLNPDILRSRKPTLKVILRATLKATRKERPRSHRRIPNKGSILIGMQINRLRSHLRRKSSMLSLSSSTLPLSNTRLSSHSMRLRPLSRLSRSPELSVDALSRARQLHPNLLLYRPSLDMRNRSSQPCNKVIMRLPRGR
jgi:hypothetical protein